MSGVGHVLDMIRRSKQNSALLGSKQSSMAKVRQMYIGICRSKTMLSDSSITPEELEKLKCEIRARIRHERKIELLRFLAAFILAVGLLLAAVLLYINKHN